MILLANIFISIHFCEQKSFVIIESHFYYQDELCAIEYYIASLIVPSKKLEGYRHICTNFARIISERSAMLQFGKCRDKPLTKPRWDSEMQADGRKWALVPKLTNLCKLLRRCLGRQSSQAFLVPFQSRQSQQQVLQQCRNFLPGRGVDRSDFLRDGLNVTHHPLVPEVVRECFRPFRQQLYQPRHKAMQSFLEYVQYFFVFQTIFCSREQNVFWNANKVMKSRLES